MHCTHCRAATHFFAIETSARVRRDAALVQKDALGVRTAESMRRRAGGRALMAAYRCGYRGLVELELEGLGRKLP